MIYSWDPSSLIPLLVLKKKVRAPQRNYLILSNQTTQAIQKSCPIYSIPTLKINFLAVLDFYRIRQYRSDSALKSLCFSFVYSHVQFAIGAWGGVSITTLNLIQIES